MAIEYRILSQMSVRKFEGADMTFVSNENLVTFACRDTESVFASVQGWTSETIPFEYVDNSGDAAWVTNSENAVRAKLGLEPLK